MTLIDSLQELLLNPRDALIRRWNWKAALFSALFRGALFFVVNLRSGWRAASAALLTEFLYRSATAGFYGSITQAFRRAQPAWKAGLAMLLVLPPAQHGIELLVHWLRGTPNLRASILASICFTGLSTLFNLYAMRRGALVVDNEGRPLREDLKRVPALLAGFLLAGPVWLWRTALPAYRR